MMQARQQRSRHRRGFTLTELAIVLLIVSFVVAAAWVAAARVWDNYRLTRVEQQMISVSQNIRNYYAGAAALPANGTAVPCAGAPAVAGNDITAMADCLGLIPTEMRRTSNLGPGLSLIDHSMNDSLATGSFHVLYATNPISGVAGNAIRLRVLGLTQSSCEKLLMLIPVVDTDIGIVGIAATGHPAVVAINNNGNDTTGAVTFPMTAATAQTWCTSLTGTNFVDTYLKLH